MGIFICTRTLEVDLVEEGRSGRPDGTIILHNKRKGQTVKNSG